MSATKNIGLGKGFDSLLPTNFDKSILIAENERIYKVNVEELSPNPDQPRKSFDDNSLEGLASSIKQHGVLQPIVVTKGKDGGYTIIAGERRWRASKMAGLKEIPAILRSSEELQRLELALIENVQRVDLSALEQAASVEYLHQQFNMTYEEIAKRLGKGTSTINNIVRLLNLPESAKSALNDSRISEGHARAILAVKKYPSKQEELLSNILKYGWSVRQAENFGISLKEGFKGKKATKERMKTETPGTKILSHKIGVPVNIKRTAKGGRLEISFASDEELNRILGLIS